jgi:hypothetical protein
MDYNEFIEQHKAIKKEIESLGYAKTEISKINPILF